MGKGVREHLVDLAHNAITYIFDLYNTMLQLLAPRAGEL